MCRLFAWCRSCVKRCQTANGTEATSRGRRLARAGRTLRRGQGVHSGAAPTDPRHARGYVPAMQRWRAERTPLTEITQHARATAKRRSARLLSGLYFSAETVPDGGPVSAPEERTDGTDGRAPESPDGTDDPAGAASEKAGIHGPLPAATGAKPGSVSGPENTSSRTCCSGAAPELTFTRLAGAWPGSH